MSPDPPVGLFCEGVLVRGWQGRRRVHAGGMCEEDNAASVDSSAAELGFTGESGLSRSAASVTLIGKPGCHLCDEAREAIRLVCDEEGAVWEEISILDDFELADRYWDQIPVVWLHGQVFQVYRVDADQLRAALAGSAVIRRDCCGTGSAAG